MADTKNVATLGPYILRVQAGALFLANEIAHKIENMYPLEEGSLRTVVGPASYVPVKKVTERLGGDLNAKGDRPFSAESVEDVTAVGAKRAPQERRARCPASTYRG